MVRCFETVDGAKPNRAISWQTHSSPSLSAPSARRRFSSASALSMSMISRIRVSFHFYMWRNIHYTGEPCQAMICMHSSGRGDRGRKRPERYKNSRAGSPVANHAAGLPEVRIEFSYDRMDFTLAEV